MGNIVTSVMHVHCSDLISHIKAEQKKKKRRKCCCNFHGQILGIDSGLVLFFYFEIVVAIGYVDILLKPGRS